MRVMRVMRPGGLVFASPHMVVAHSSSSSAVVGEGSVRLALASQDIPSSHACAFMGCCTLVLCFQLHVTRPWY